MPSPPYETPTAAEFITSREKSLLGRVFQMKDIGQEGVLHWRCKAVTLWQQSDHPKKVAILMRLELERVEGLRHHGPVGAIEGSVEYRLGYYIVNRKGRWHWGQYALMLPAEDFGGFIEKAVAEGTLRPEDLPSLARR